MVDEASAGLCWAAMSPTPRRLALTAELIRARFPGPGPDDHSATPLMPEEEIAARLGAFLAERGPEDLWVFAYGSLIWNPDLDFAERRMARLIGWHRRFCLWQRRWRATSANPGLMLALDRGGSCRGVVYRIAAQVRDKFAGVWRREMIDCGYSPRRLVVQTQRGSVTALTFVVNRESVRYAGRLAEETAADKIAAACGHIGPSAAYLLDTVAHLEQLGIHDRHLWRLQELVAERLVRVS
jgi:glutathione-specific gamma-glutamylcyclotransferase